MEISFDSNGDWKHLLTQAYSYRFTETPDFAQADDHITTAINPMHREGFDNISLLSKDRYTHGVRATLQCSFEELGCPEIILVEKAELCSDQAVRYGACFEIVLWKNGVNVWRHYMDETTHQCSWHKRLGFTAPIEENRIHELSVEIIKNYIVFSVDGISIKLRTEDLPERFYIGTTGCEGIVRLYKMCIEQGTDNSTEDQVS